MMKAVLQALMDCAIFFELSDDDVVDPDAAVQQLEQIQHSLLAVAAADQGTLRRELEALALEQGSAERRAVVEIFLGALPEFT
jgi:hypothetical protein